MTDSNATPYSSGSSNASPAVNPGRTLGIVGLVLGIIGFFIFFLAPIAGLIVSILGLNKSKKVGQKNGLAVAGIIVSIIALIANIIAVIALIAIGTSLGGVGVDLLQQCQSDPNGFVEFQGEQISCAQILQSTN